MNTIVKKFRDLVIEDDLICAFEHLIEIERDGLTDIDRYQLMASTALTHNRKFVISVHERLLSCKLLIYRAGGVMQSNTRNATVDEQYLVLLHSLSLLPLESKMLHEYVLGAKIVYSCGSVTDYRLCKLNYINNCTRAINSYRVY